MQRTTAGALRRGFALLAVFVLAGAGVRIVLAEIVASKFQSAAADITDARDANQRVLQHLTDVETGIRGYQLTHDRRFLRPTENGREAFPAAMAEALAGARDDKTRALLRRENGLAASWLDGFAGPIASTDPADLRDDPQITITGKALFDGIRDANTSSAAALQQDSSEALEEIARLNRISELVGLGLSVLAIAGVLILARHLSRLLLAPLTGLRATLVRLNNGDHSARAPVVGPPETREVIRNFNELCDESDRLRTGEQRRMRTHVLGHEIGSRVRQSLQRSAVLDEVVAGLGHALGVHRVYVQLVRDGHICEIERQWHSPGLRPLDVAVPSPLSLSPAEQPGRMDVCDDVPGDPAVNREFIDATRAGALIRTTFGFDSEVFGVVVMMQVGEPRRWVPDELALADSVSGDLGRAFEHVRLYEHERDVAERMRDIDQQKTDFIATVSHELRTPLTSVLGYLEVLISGDQGPIPDRQLKSLKVIARNAERLGEMVGDLLTLSRIEAGTFNLDRGLVAVTTLVEGALETVGPAAEAAGLVVDVDVPPQLQIDGDANQLRRVIANLVGNSVKFTERGGRIRIEAHADGPELVRITVSDTGSGIPPAEQENLFKAFFRGSNAVQNAVQGPGLGLAVVQSIVEQHRGRVELLSELGGGTQVTVTLPRAESSPRRARAAATTRGTS